MYSGQVPDIREAEADSKFPQAELGNSLDRHVVHHLDIGEIDFVPLLHEPFRIVGGLTGSDAQIPLEVSRILPPVGKGSCIHVMILVYILHLVLDSRVVIVASECVRC